jgi:hypothetical protein
MARTKKDFKFNTVKDVGYHGVCVYDKKEIKINTSNGDARRQRVAFFHELLHAVRGPLSRLRDEALIAAEHKDIEKFGHVGESISNQIHRVKNYPLYVVQRADRSCPVVTPEPTEVEPSALGPNTVLAILRDARSLATYLLKDKIYYLKMGIKPDEVKLLVNLMLEFKDLPPEDTIIPIEQEEQ